MGEKIIIDVDDLKDYIEGNTEKGSSLIESAVDDGTLSEFDITRDPILNTLAVSI